MPEKSTITIAALCGSLLFVPTALFPGGGGSPDVETAVVLENRLVRYSIDAAGRVAEFHDTSQGEARVARGGTGRPAASVVRQGQSLPATRVYAQGDRWIFEFGGPEVRAVVSAQGTEYGLLLTLESISDAQVDEIVFFDVSLVGATEGFSAAAVPRNAWTRVDGYPGLQRRLRARAYRDPGFEGASVAIVAGASRGQRERLQQAVGDAPDLPRSTVGGPWALDSDRNFGSYLFNFRGLSEETVDAWIEQARSLGIDQITFHAGQSFRHGDLEPDPQTYPKGMESVRNVVDRLHDAGILAGLQVYSFFLSKDTPWVARADPRLGHDRVFSLARRLKPDGGVLEVRESTEGMSTIVGWPVRNSLTLRVGDELIRYAGLTTDPPYRFTEIERGAHGSRVGDHPAGTPVYHLRECFGLFVPQGDSTLFTEIAERAAEMVNRAGFDALYFDAIDGADAISGLERRWYHSGKFVFEVARRLERPTIMEMSAISSQLWVVRSRIEAWDYPLRGHKRFIDMHVERNRDFSRMYLPGHLGWWSFRDASGFEEQRTFPDDVEYLMTRSLATDAGISIIGPVPGEAHRHQDLHRIVRRYEELRRSGYFSDEVKQALRVPGDEYTLEQDSEGEWYFRRVRYESRTVGGRTGHEAAWSVENRFARQNLRLRIEGLTATADAEGTPALAAFDGADEFGKPRSASGVELSLQTLDPSVSEGPIRARLKARSTRERREGAWGCLSKTFDPPLDRSKAPLAGLWVDGDGSGAVLNVQWTSPRHVSDGIADHYVTLDFEGPRYFELVEPEADRWPAMEWPYGHRYSIFLNSPRPDRIDKLTLCLNRIPSANGVSVGLGPIHSRAVAEARIERPRITIGRRSLVLPVTIGVGEVLDCGSAHDCRLLGPAGETIRRVRPGGRFPRLEPGENRLRMNWDATPGSHPRARVTVITRGGELRGRAPAGTTDR